jgi:hypothetical protein
MGHNLAFEANVAVPGTEAWILFLHYDIRNVCLNQFGF